MKDYVRIRKFNYNFETVFFCLFVKTQNILEQYCLLLLEVVGINYNSIIHCADQHSVSLFVITQYSKQ